MRNGGKSVFETGAGIGDHTQFLLSAGVKRLLVNEGRGNLADHIRQRFAGDARVRVLPGNLESCLALPEFQFKADLIYCYGTLYHLANPFEVLAQLSKIGTSLALETRLGDASCHGLRIPENPDHAIESISGFGNRLLPEELVTALKPLYRHVYKPNQPGGAFGGRIMLVASHEPVILNHGVEL